MPIKKKIAVRDGDESKVSSARAYGGPADGQRWIVSAAEDVGVHRFGVGESFAYTLALDPRTGLPVSDSFGYQVYLADSRSSQDVTAALLPPARPHSAVAASSTCGFTERRCRTAPAIEHSFRG